MSHEFVSKPGGGRAARVAATACILTLIATPAAAYIGPGAGLSLLGALWAVVAAVAAALFFVLAWPVRRMLRRRRLQTAQASASSPGSASPTTRAPD